MELDLLITGGNVVDGTGRPAFQTDIGIKDGLIVWMHSGAVPDRPATATSIDAQGLIVTPGFIGLFTSPRHPCTLALMSAIPDPNPHVQKKRILLEGDVPSPVNPPCGCVFKSRCFKKKEICENTEPPPLREVANGHFVSCYLYE